MSEEDVRGGLRDAVADEPALDFDPDALVATARHQIRRRRALMAAGVATALVAVAAVALPVALGRQPTGVEAGQAPAPATRTTTTTTTPTRIAWPPADVKPVRHTTEELRTRGERMAAHLRQTLPVVLPKASAIEVGPFGGEAVGEFYEGQTSVNATVDYTFEGARYSIDIQVWAPGGANDLLDQACTDCQQIGEQDGGPLATSTQSVMGEGRIVSVYHLRKDGGAVRIAAYNYQLSGSKKLFAHAIPLTVDQLLRLAADPELGL